MNAITLASEARRQADLLEALILAATKAREPASRRMLFASPQGLALVNAAADLFECDALYDIARDVTHEIEADACQAVGASPGFRSRLYSRLIGGGE